MQKLRAATAEKHKAAEAVSFSGKIMSGTLSCNEYTVLVKGNYIVHRLLEEKLRGVIPAHHPIDLPAREKLPLLIRDLEDLGIDHEKLDIEFAAAYLPAITSLPAAVGCLYVLEGSTLGGNVIYKALKKSPATSSFPMNYYCCYGAQTGAMWKAFTDQINAMQISEHDEAEIITNAKQTFDLYIGVFSGV